MAPLDYTQHTKAWPWMAVSEKEPWHVDEVTVSLAADGGGVEGEIIWTFMRFDGGSTGVRLHAFGDSLDCLYDDRIQRVIAKWRAMPEPDALTPEGLIAILDSVGVVPSEYHERGTRGVETLT